MSRLAVLLVLLQGSSFAAEYARPEMLIEPLELEAALAEEGADLVVLHAASPADYFRVRVPGAVLVEVPRWKSAFGDGSDSEAWSRRISRLGVGPESRVVVYDEGVAHQTSSARVWWILKYWGVEDAAILNGGLQAWVDHAGAGIPPGAQEPKPGGFVAWPQAGRLKTTEQMIKLSRGGSARILDTRSADEYAAGVIGADTERCEWGEVLDPTTGRYKTADKLRRVLRLDELQGAPTVTYCRSGGRASVTAFALELMGVEDVANYYGSWNAWSASEASER